MTARVALAGNPNSGKTTLFNALTGANQYVGNWPGVTVEKREAVFDINDSQANIIDLPGAYSLNPYSIEERVARDFLCEGGYDIILNIVDVTNIERNLFYTYQLLTLGKPVIVALNMMDELDGAGGRVDALALSRELGGARVIPLSAKRQTGFDELFCALDSIISRLTPSLRAPVCASHFDESALYARIRGALERAGYVRRAPGRARLSDLIDGVVLNRFFAYPLLICALGLMFYIAFGAPGRYLTYVMQRLTGVSGALIERATLNLPAWARSFALDGVWAGVSGVICFLPQVLLLFLCMALIEDSGYMARAAFLMDKLLRRLGLSGRSVIPILMGLGCTTTAVLAARGVDSERDRRLTVMLTPCMSCGAKLPVYSFVAGAFFPGREFLVILSLYALGVIIMALGGAYLSKRVLTEGDAPFLMELPPYRRPVMRAVRRRLAVRAGDFVKRAGTLIVLLSAVAWFFRYFAPDLTSAGSIDESMLARAGAWLSPALKPMGFAGWDKAVALLSGLVAKEGVLSTLQVIYRAPDAAALALALKQSFEGALGAYSFLAFFLLYPPCVSAAAAMGRELGSYKLLCAVLLIELCVAALSCGLIYGLGTLIFRL